MSFSRTGLRKPVKIVWRGRNVASTFRNPVAACYSPGEMHAQTPGPHRSHYNSRTNGRWIRARPSPLINIPRHEHTHVFATPDALRANYTARYCHRVSFHLLRGHDLRFDTIDIPTNYPRRIGKTITNFRAIWNAICELWYGLSLGRVIAFEEIGAKIKGPLSGSVFSCLIAITRFVLQSCKKSYIFHEKGCVLRRFLLCLKHFHLEQVTIRGINRFQNQSSWLKIVTITSIWKGFMKFDSLGHAL